MKINNRKQLRTIILLSGAMVFLAVATLIISLQVQKKDPATDLPPRASNPACEIAFLLNPEPTATPTPNPIATATPTPNPTPNPTPGACNATCQSNAQCGSNLVCSNGFCRNPDCVEQPNCACYFVPTPKVPVTGMGTTVAGIAIIAGGILLLLLGLLF